MTKRAFSLFAALILLASALLLGLAERAGHVVWAGRHIPLYADGMPRVVDVDGITWRVVLEPLTPPLTGYTYCDKRVILLKPDTALHREYLMHELSHALVCTDAGGRFQARNMVLNSKSNEDHEGIYLFSEMWAELLHRNPDLARYLGGS